MKHYRPLLAAAILSAAIGFHANDSYAQNYGYPEGKNAADLIREDTLRTGNNHHIYEYVDLHDTRAPKGYKAFYISHYGRHGSRYAYARETYTDLLEMLRKAEQEGNITEYGKALSLRLADFYEKVRYRVGDLTDKGWNQQKMMADKMYSDYPQAFGKDSDVRACASSSIRAIMSMTSFCTELSRIAPKTEIIAHQGVE